MKIRKAHILVRHFYNMEDDSGGIFYTEEGGGVDWLWDVIQDTVGLFVNNNQEIRRLGGQTYNEQQRRVLLEMPMDSLVGLSRGPERKVLIVYDCWKHLVVTSYPCAPRSRDLQPEEDDGWLSS